MFSKVNNYLRRLDIKLTIYYTSILLIISCLLLYFIYYRLERNLLKQVDRILYDETLELVRNAEKPDFNFKLACESFGKEISHRKNYPIYFRVLTPSGDIYFESVNSKKLSIPSSEQNQSSFYTFTGSGRTYPYRIYQKILILNDDRFIIQIATPIKLPEKILENYLENIILIIPIILILSIVCGLLVSRKPREILRNIITTTNSINSQNLKERLPAPKAKDEIKDLVLTINSMMDRLEKAFKEIKQFTSDVSHELRTPIFSLKGEMEVALSKMRNSEEYKKVIHESLERVDVIIKMINDLFLISRFELKKVDLDLIHLDLNEILKDLFDFFLPMAQEKNLNITIERCDNVLVNADKTRIYQLFSNLIDNAIKFTPENGYITLSLTSQKDLAKLVIKDSGIGIPEADIPHIFNRFYQVDKSRSKSYRGSGLGLNICKKIVEAHKGNVMVERNKDKGVTFIVTLPKTQ